MKGLFERNVEIQDILLKSQACLKYKVYIKVKYNKKMAQQIWLKIRNVRDRKEENSQFSKQEIFDLKI